MEKPFMALFIPKIENRKIKLLRQSQAVLWKVFHQSVPANLCCCTYLTSQCYLCHIIKAVFFKKKAEDKKSFLFAFKPRLLCLT